MSIPQTVSLICAIVIFIATGSTAVFAWFVCRTDGHGRSASFIWGVYGMFMTGLCFFSLRYALFGFGVIAPLLSQNVSRLLSIRVFGPGAQRDRLAILINRGGSGYFVVGSLVSAALQASVGAVLLLVVRHGPAAWLGAGILVSPLGALAATIRLALQPPTVKNDGPENKEPRDHTQSV